MDRYARQELIVGVEGQSKLRQARVAIVGIGALGTVCAELLTRAGVGTLVLIDRDFITLDNLQRQSLFTEADVGKLKAIQAKAHLQEIHSTVLLEAHATDLTAETIDRLLGSADFILDCTDTMETRFLINEYCVREQKKWMYGAAIRDEGYTLLVDPQHFCFSCIFKERSHGETCDTVGVFNSITHMIASFQVHLALQELLGKSQPSLLYHLSLQTPTLRSFTVRRKPTCTVCVGKAYPHLDQHDVPLLKLCGSGVYQMRARDLDLQHLKTTLSRLGSVDDLGVALRFKELYVFSDRVLLHAATEAEARALYAKYIGG